MILYGISYSPWSLRARWALEHHRHSFSYREYIPMISTATLRAKIGDFRTKVTVPLLIDGTDVIRDSYDIARRADRDVEAPSLFAAGEEVTRSWTATADQIAEAGRVLATFGVMANPTAIRENVPAFIPGWARGLSTPLVSLGSRYLAAKYDFSAEDIDDARRTMRGGLERIANQLVDAEYLADDFGFSDIAAACALQFVKPANDWIRLGDASVAAWTQDELAHEFSDVLRWRDTIVRNHRLVG